MSCCSVLVLMSLILPSLLSLWEKQMIEPIRGSSLCCLDSLCFSCTLLLVWLQEFPVPDSLATSFSRVPVIFSVSWAQFIISTVCAVIPCCGLWQRGPVHWAVQEHVNPFTPSVQVPPLRQGLLAHSLMFWSQFDPCQPELQMQVYPGEEVVDYSGNSGRVLLCINLFLPFWL